MASGHQERLLFVRHGMPTFVARDLEILRRHFDVVEVAWKGGIHTPFDIIRVRHAISGCDVAYARFAGTHAAVMVREARRRGIPAAVTLGGYDVANNPDIGYGAFTRLKERPFAAYVLRHADALFPVDEGLLHDAEAAVAGAATRCQVIHNGYDIDSIPPGPLEGRHGVLCVALADNAVAVRRKGLHDLVACARNLPDHDFHIIGVSGQGRRSLGVVPSNVTVERRRPLPEVLDLMRSAKVVCQLSVREGFPNALCEAMLSGCIPVGTDVQGVRTVIGDAGYLVPLGDVQAATDAIRKAHASGLGASHAARGRIESSHPIERREKELVSALQSLIR